MALEIEAKIKVDSLEPFRVKLAELGAKLAGEFLETNAIFDTEDHSLQAADKGLRVRAAKTATGEQCTMTYKGPRRPGALKTRDETEVSVDDFKKAVELLEVLSFKQVLSFEKKRQTWHYDTCKVELDELPGNLGLYVEIEGGSEQAIAKVQQALGLGHRQLIKTSYVGMVMSHLQDKGHGVRVMTFA
jgi:predicted adenylyl cyclase CyaB